MVDRKPLVGTELDEERFTCGDCHYLARALHLLTGWPIVAFQDSWGRPDVHAMVKMPNGKLLDIYGPQSVRTARRHWCHFRRARGRPIKEFSWSIFREEGWNSPSYGEYTYRRAKIIAQRLLREIGYA
jgi:hypothetical protein